MLIEIELSKGKWRKTYRRRIALAWSDWSESRRRYALRQLLSSDAEDAKLKIVQRDLLLPKHITLAMSDDQWAAILVHYDWLHLDGTEDWILTTFKYRGVRWSLPTKSFENGTAIEFAMAEQCLEIFVQSKTESDLRQLAASLLAPTPISSGAIWLQQRQRQTIGNRGDMENRARQLRGLPYDLLVSVLLYFLGAKKQLNDAYGKYLFDAPPPDESDKITDAVVAGYPIFGWWAAFLQLAEAGTFGDYDAVLKTNFHRICMFFIEKQKQYAVQKEHLEVQKKKNK